LAAKGKNKTRSVKKLRMCAICEKIELMDKFTRFCSKKCRESASKIEGNINEYKFSIPRVRR
jgi:hypothetical protein